MPYSKFRYALRDTGGVTPPSLFDTATAIYSLRQITTNSSNCIRVRRSSDNALQDIGFSGGILDTASMLTFVGVNNGFIETWYDQSTNLRPATQTTNGSQPQIVASGSLITDGGKPTIQFQTSLKILESMPAGALISTPSGYLSCVFNPDIAGTADIVGVICETVSSFRLQSFSISADFNGAYLLSDPGFVGSGIATNLLSQQQLMTSKHDSGTMSTHIDGSLRGSRSVTSPIINTNQFRIGGLTASFPYAGNLQELIVFNTDQSANQSAIENNTISFYSI